LVDIEILAPVAPFNVSTPPELVCAAAGCATKTGIVHVVTNITVTADIESSNLIEVV
jgi:hypothetical protein